MPDLARLTVEVTDKGISITSKELDKLKLSATGAAKATDELTDANKKVAPAVSKTNKSFLEMSSGFKIVGRDLSRYITLPLLAAGAASFKFGSDLHEGLALVESLIPGTTGRIDELGQAVKDTAIRSGKGFDDLTEGLYQTISAFQDGEDTVARFNTVTNAAVAGNASVRSSLELLSAVTKGYDDTTAEAVDRVADLAFETIRLGQTTFPELASSIQKVTSLSSTLGVSQEELFAVFAALTGVTGDAAEVSTQFSSALASLLTPSEEMAQLLKGLGLESGKALIEERGLIGAFQTIADTAEASGISLFKFTKRKEALKAVIALTTAQEDEFIDKLYQIQNAAGAQNKALDAVTNGTNAYGFQLKQAKERLAVLGDEIYDVFIPALTGAITFISKLGEGFINLDPISQQVIVSLATLAASIGPLLIVGGSLIRLIALLKTSMDLLNISFGPIGIALAVLTAGVTLYGIATGSATKALQEQKETLNAAHKEQRDYIASLDDLVRNQIEVNDEQEISVELVKELTIKYPALIGQVDLYSLALADAKVALINLNREEQAAKGAETFAKQIKDFMAFQEQVESLADQFANVEDIARSATAGWNTLNKTTKEGLISGLKEATLRDLTELEREQQALIDQINAEAEKLGFKAFEIDFGMSGVGFEAILAQVEDFVTRTKAGFDTVVNIAPKAEGLKTWQEWFSDITDVAISKFATIKEVFDKATGDLISRDFIGAGQGTKAGMAYIAELQSVFEDSKVLEELTGGDTGNLFNFDSTSATIDDIKGALTQLLAIKKEVIAGGETFEFGDKVVTVLIDEINRRKELQRIYESGVIRDELASEIDLFDRMNISLGLAIDSYDALTEKKDMLKNALQDALAMDDPDLLLVSQLVDRLDAVSEVISRTFQGAKDDVLDFTAVVEEDLFNAFAKVLDLAPSLSLVFAEMTTAIASMAGSLAVSGIEEFGKSLAQGRDAGESYRDMIAGIAAGILDMLPMLFIQAGLQLIGQGQTAVGLGFIAAGLTSSFINGLSKGSTEDVTANATGNAFSDGNIIPFASGGSFTNSIVNKATPFQFGGALGVMGEKGDEAIMPLTRTSSGNLGVETTGRGGDTNVTIKIINNTGAEVTTSETKTTDGKEIEIMIGNIVKTQMANGGYDKAMSSRYGTKVRGISA